MREIKFRAWDKENNKMYYNTEKHTVWVGGVEACVTGEDCRHKNIPYEFTMQFTGLHDKNGKEIYEGDIIKFGKRSELKGISNFQVFWSENYCTFKTKNYLTETPEWRHSEVIGNIYENPELLEEQCQKE